MEIALIIKYLVFALSSVFSIVFIMLAYKLLTANENEYRANRERIGHWYMPLTGRIKTFHDGQRDYRVHAGLAVDLRHNKWVEQGALSDEALDSVIRH